MVLYALGADFCPATSVLQLFFEYQIGEVRSSCYLFQMLLNHEHWTIAHHGFPDCWWLIDATCPSINAAMIQTFWEMRLIIGASRNLQSDMSRSYFHQLLMVNMFIQHLHQSIDATEAHVIITSTVASWLPRPRKKCFGKASLKALSPTRPPGNVRHVEACFPWGIWLYGTCGWFSNPYTLNVHICIYCIHGSYENETGYFRCTFARTPLWEIRLVESTQAGVVPRNLSKPTGTTWLGKRISRFRNQWPFLDVISYWPIVRYQRADISWHHRHRSSQWRSVDINRLHHLPFAIYQIWPLVVHILGCPSSR